MNTTSAIINRRTGVISAIVNGKSFTVPSDHPAYTQVVTALQSGDADTFVKLVDVASSVRAFVAPSNGTVTLVNGQVLYRGEVLHNSITDRVLDLMRKGYPVEPLLLFLGNLLLNPSKRAVDELYGFLETGKLPITNDGHFLAFKNVQANFYSIRGNKENKLLKGKTDENGHVFNGVGEEIEMERNLVDEDKSRTCSNGLHFCSQDYLPNFSAPNGHTMIMKINPRDVVAIPADYNDTKGRCCRYVVAGELNAGKTTADVTGKAVVTDYDPKPAKVASGNTQDYDKGFEDGATGAAPTSKNPDYVLGYEAGQDSVAEVEPKGKTAKSTQDIYGTKPSGHKFYNVHGKGGRFTSRK